MSYEPEKWSSIEEIAEHIQVHRDTIRIWIRRGEIPAHKIGKQWRFKISDIDEWVKSGKSADINKGTS
ncbi:MAG: helix-turn-helix domain-containing protein [Gracilibacteraceae bacterium]|jgi:excisionase family DNA binding protein|nr:helix-turn-helix domain-containing protein [Gracilibacteraceae bacterium]